MSVSAMLQSRGTEPINNLFTIFLIVRTHAYVKFISAFTRKHTNGNKGCALLTSASEKVTLQILGTPLAMNESHHADMSA
jgi:hypothetical protein